MSRRTERWTDDEIGFLLDHPHLSSRQIGDALGKGPQAAQHMRTKLRSGWERQKEAWTAAEDAVIQETTHLTAEEVASRLARTAAAVQGRRSVLRSTKSLRPAYKPWHIGRRRLVCRTCRDCGRLLDARWFYRSESTAWRSTCSRCRSEALGGRRAQVTSTPALKRNKRAHAERMQSLSLPFAEKHRQPWTSADTTVLADPDLTVLEKAIRLRRTYHATQAQLTANRFPSRIGHGDPERAQWFIRRAS